MNISCCPGCRGKNIHVLVVEIWQKDRSFKIDEEGKLVEINPEDPYFKDESYDSRRLLCLDCNKEFPTHDLDEIESQIDEMYP